MPPIPKLNGEVLLDVFTHRSLRFEGAPTDETSEYGDNMRLATLGEALLECLEHFPKLANLDFVEKTLFPTLRVAIEKEDQRERSRTASDGQFKALKCLARVIRQVQYFE